MFSQEARCRYRKNQLGEVICQLRFPQILTIETNVPAAFQEAIRATFPQYSCHRETPPPKLVNGRAEPQQPTNNYQFVSEDGHWRVNLTPTFISLACNRYTCWEDFAQMLDMPLAAFIQTYRPAYFERVGLRYLNFFSRSALSLEDTPLRELIHSRYLGILADEELLENAAARATVDAEFAIRGGCRAKIHAGPGLIKRNGVDSKEVHFIFDQDLYMPGKIAVNLSAGALQTLHAQAFPIFRDAITDTLHDAMEPTEL